MVTQTAYLLAGYLEITPDAPCFVLPVFREAQSSGNESALYRQVVNEDLIVKMMPINPVAPLQLDESLLTCPPACVGCPVIYGFRWADNSFWAGRRGPLVALMMQNVRELQANPYVHAEVFDLIFGPPRYERLARTGRLDSYLSSMTYDDFVEAMDLPPTTAYAERKRKGYLGFRDEKKDAGAATVVNTLRQIPGGACLVVGDVGGALYNGIGGLMPGFFSGWAAFFHSTWDFEKQEAVEQKQADEAAVAWAIDIDNRCLDYLADPDDPQVRDLIATVAEGRRAKGRAMYSLFGDAIRILSPFYVGPDFRDPSNLPDPYSISEVVDEAAFQMTVGSSARSFDGTG